MFVEPTVPKLIVLPLTVPWMAVVVCGSEILIVPLRLDPDCCQVRLNVPWKDPL
jgi:hypothetical protein